MPTSISVVLPTFRAAGYLSALFTTLRAQSIPPLEIIVVDSSSDDGTAELAAQAGCRVQQISQPAFNHGTTRNLAASMSRGEVLVFLTQDALPAGEGFLAALTEPLQDERCAAAYGRQIPRAGASPLEQFLRLHNYPPTSGVRSLADTERMGLRAFSMSNVASAVRKREFEEAGGFPHCLLNEDVRLAARLMSRGYCVTYVAQAVVYHSHDLSLRGQFHRYFDIGAALAQSGKMLARASAHADGWSFAIGQMRYLAQQRHWAWMPRSAAESIVKFLAFQIGKRQRLLPRRVNKRLSMCPFYWDQTA